VRKKMKAGHDAGSSQTGGEEGREDAVHGLGNITTELELQDADAVVRSGGVGNQLGLNAEDELAVAVAEGVHVDSVLTQTMGFGGIGENEGWGITGEDLGLDSGGEGDIGGGKDPVGGGGFAKEGNDGIGADEIMNNSEGDVRSKGLETRTGGALLEGQHQLSTNPKKRLHNQDTGSTEGGEASQHKVPAAQPSDKRHNSHSVVGSEGLQVGCAGLPLSSGELAASNEFCASSEGESAHENEAGAPTSTKATAMPLTAAEFIEEFQREQSAMFRAHFHHLQTVHVALADKNTELVLDKTTLQKEVTQLKTQLLESTTLAQAQHEAEITQLKAQLLESKTLSQAQAQTNSTLLGKYQNLQAAVRTSMDRLQSL
jgi:hypothetical protein